MIIDISVPVNDTTPVWPGNKKPSIEMLSDMREGASHNESFFAMNAHTGTHIDAPLHFIANGQSIDKMSANIFIGPVYVADMTQVDEITANSLEKKTIPDGTERILFRTRNSSLWDKKNIGFRKDYVGLTPDAAEWLAEKKIRLVGNDYLSVARYEDAALVHNVLLKNGAALLEGINLSKVEEGKYTLLCLPVNIEKAEAAPTRAVLIRE